MSWFTVEDMIEKAMIPLDVIDAKGRVIESPITAFDDETGEVEMYLIDRENEYPESRRVMVLYDGQQLPYVLNEAGEEFMRVVRKFKAPLTWKKLEVVST